MRTMRTEMWSIDRFVFYARNPRKSYAAVDRMAALDPRIRIQSPGAGAQRRDRGGRAFALEAARKLGITEIPVILCD